MIKSYYLTILIIILCNLTATAQSYYFRHYQVENGLSHNTAFSVLQDQQGFIWFGTKDGLNRFDGHSFKIFRNNPADSNSLGNNFVYSLFLDKEQRLWVGTAKGLCEFIRKEETFKVVPGTFSGDLYDIREDDRGRLWYVMGGRLYYYDKQLQTSILFQPASNQVVSALHIEAGNKIWYATYSTLNCYSASEDSIRSYNVFNHSRYTTGMWIRRIAKGTAGNLLIGTTDQGLKEFNYTSASYTDILSQNTDKTNIYVRDIIESSPGIFWIGTESGIFIYDVKQKSFTNLKKSFTNPYSLSDNAVYSLFKDQEGGVWAGTYFGGINYYRKQYSSFEKYFPDNTSNTISGNAVREICEDESGNIWIGTEDRGLNKLHKKTGAFTHYLPGTGSKSISYYNIHGLLYTQNHLWIGTFEHGIDVMDTRSGQVVKHFDNNTAGIRNNFFLSFYKTRNGSILAGNTLDLLLYHPASDSFSKVEEVPGPNFIYHIMEDSEGFIWVSTIGHGLYYYHPVTKQKGHFTFNAADTEGISSNLINNCFEDSRGYLWIATEGGGLCRYDKKEKRFKRYSTADGLPADFIFKTLEDDQKQLWITTTRGLVRMNPDNDQITLYTTSNGILNDQFNYNSGYKDAEGRLFFGSVKGMISFNPKQFSPNNFRPPIYITGLQVHNKEFVPKDDTGVPQSITTTQRIRLPYNQASFSVDFAALSYTAPEMMQYAYIMHGLQEGWTTIETNRKAYFTDLAPGTYIFMVKAAGNNKEWSQSPATLTIEILPPWWESNLAYLAYILAGMGFSYWIVSFLYNRARERTRRRIEHLAHEKEKELYEAKIEFFTQVAHEIKTPLTLIKAPLEKIAEQVAPYPEVHKNLHTMQKNTKRLLDLTNQLLDFRLTESRGYSLNFTKLNISDMVQDIYTDFKPIAEQKNITYHLTITDSGIYAEADEDALEKIFSNLFSNAIKYSAKAVNVHLQKSDGVFELGLFNDGYIIPPDKSEKIFEPFFRLKETDRQKGTGIGLALSKSLAILHKGSLMLQNNNLLKGNTFVLKIPLQTDASITNH